jgi:pimeloyl-ACP methyl ester carboxylesterase
LKGNPLPEEPHAQADRRPCRRGGHGVHFDEPQQFNTALLAFLQDVRKAD